MDRLRRQVFDDRGVAFPLSRGRAQLTGREAIIYLIGAAWIGLVWSPDYVPSLPAFVGAIVAIGAIHVVAQVVYAPSILWQSRRRGLCASCGYDLAGIRPEPDGCRICPECGAAWKTSG